MNRRICSTAIAVSLFIAAAATPQLAHAQVPPSQVTIEIYKGPLKAAAAGDVAAIEKLAAAKVDLNMRDPSGRTPLMVAAHLQHYDAVRALLAAGADINALDKDRYDVITIAAVADDAEMIRIAVAGGGNPKLITSRYDGTALIAAAHLGHDEVVKTLIESGAPLDHVNNLNWTALIEAIVLGDGGARHTETVRALVSAGADLDIPDGNGIRPLTLAEQRGYRDIFDILKTNGAKP
ncbi:MAG: ankyrin repeat domain-containing protein [Alphaproteobacteria bacterium]|nr:ankyrin repeat domain-containing protein [Alphaproteobacteria bacterium]